MLKAVYVLLFCIFAFACATEIIGYSSCQQPPKDSSETTEAAKNNKHNCSTPYAALKVGLSQIWTFAHEYDKEVTAVGTAFIAIFAIILGLSTVVLAQSTRALVVSADDASQRQLRAYISIDPKNTLNWTQQKYKVGVSFVLKNHGRTPGSETSYNFKMDILDCPLPDDYVFASTDRKYDQNNTVFPDHTLPVRLLFDRDLTVAERKGIEKGTKRFHTWGVLSYRDTFSDTPRTTKLSFSFGGEQFARHIIDPKVEWFWEWGPTHNDAT